MSNYRMVNINCPKCGVDAQFRLWGSINSVVSPEIVDKLLNYELYLWVCPVCGARCQVPYNFLFHYMEEMRLIAVGCDYREEIKKIRLPEGYIYEEVDKIDKLVEILNKKRILN